MRARRFVVGGLFAALLTGGVTSAVVTGSGTSSSSLNCYGPCKAEEGYWLVGSDGGIFSAGRARFHGSIPLRFDHHLRLAAPVVGMASTPYGRGYWITAGDGGVFNFGNARFGGSLPGILKKKHTHLRAPVVGVAGKGSGGDRGATNTGYWLAAADGGVFTFGSAHFYGSVPQQIGKRHLAEPVVGIASQPNGTGYWMVAKDGGVFSFGGAKFYKSVPWDVQHGILKHGVTDIVAMTPTPSGKGYWLVGADGGVYSFGNAHFYGSLPYYSLFAGSSASLQNGPIVGIAATPDGGGYWIALATGYVYAFGDADRLKELQHQPSHPIVGISALSPTQKKAKA
jgi:hypothetical protein